MTDITAEDWALVEQAAKAKIERHFKPGKNQVVLGGTDRFHGKKRFSVVFEGIPSRRKCLHMANQRSTKIAFSDRIVTVSAFNLGRGMIGTLS